MANALSLVGEVTASATALAGLILVFLGAISSSYQSYQRQEQTTVRGRYQRRAWFSFAGFVLALASATLALIGKWLAHECMAFSAIILLFAALGMVLLAALFSVLDIK